MADGDREAPRDRHAPPQQAARAQARGARLRARGRAATARRDLDAALDDDVGDDLLRLVFTACHPVLSTEARVALTLRLLGGLTTDEIARAFLVPEPTIAQRIVRAKRTLAEAQRAVRGAARRRARARGSSSVLEVIYLIFNEGYSATAGDDWMRPALCEDALRLGRILAELAPDEPEVHGLVALMEIQASRARARASAPTASPILLLDQNRARWDQLLIRRGLAALERAEAARRARRALRAAGRDRRVSRAARAPAEETDWARIAALYDELASACRRRCRAEPRGRGGDGVGPGGRPRARRYAASTSRRSRAITCCRACAATCWQARAPRRGARSSSARPSLTRNARERDAAARPRRRVPFVIINLSLHHADS